MTSRPPISDKITGLRQRQRANGSWRIWWEPNAAARAAGFEAVELDTKRLSWSVREAERINRDVKRKRGGEQKRAVGAGGRTISALINDYKQSISFRELEGTTRRGYLTNLNAIDAKWGSSNALELSKPILRTWYESLFEGSGPAQAQSLIRTFSILMSHAEVRGWRPENSNPCFNLQMRSVPPRDRYATWKEYDALVSAAHHLGFEAIRCAIALATFQAQRQTDIIAAQRSQFRAIDAVGTDTPVLTWELIRSKRDNYGAMKVHDEALPFVQSALDAETSNPFLLIDEATGREYSGDLFRKRWAAVRKQAAKTTPSVRTLQFRDLRRTFAVWARAGGASKEDVGDVLGNSAALDPQLGETYMPPSYHTSARAIDAIQRPGEKEEGHKDVG